MQTTLAFDVYGTLIDTNGVVDTLRNFIGARAEQFSAMWRSKQLEYSFRRGLMQDYVDFGVCTQQALDFTCRALQIDLTLKQKENLLALYLILPAFPEVAKGLKKLKQKGFRVFAFSNGAENSLKTLLANAGIADLFEALVSVDDLKTFKPSPASYAHFRRKSGAIGTETWLISCNSFDILGAHASGMKTAWVHRDQSAFLDPWGIKPTLEVTDVIDFAEKLQKV